MVDSNVFFKLKTSDDYRRAEDEFNLARQLQEAQIQKALQPDVSQLGEQGLLKIAQGIQPSPQEFAAAQVLDAKSGGFYTNVATGAVMNKPRISDKLGFGGLTPPTSGVNIAPTNPTQFNNPGGASKFTQGLALQAPTGPIVSTAPSGVNLTPQQANAGVNELYPAPSRNMDAEMNAELAKYADNPKAQQTIREKYINANAPGTKFEQSNKLRDEFTTNTKTFRELQDAYSKMNKISDSAAGDIALLYATAKLNDPGSVVRESEFAVQASAGSLGDRWKNLVGKIESGQRLTPSQRQQLKDEANNLYQGQLEGYDRFKNQYKDLALRNGLKVEDVVVDYAQPVTTPAPSAPKSPGPQDMQNARRARDGNLYIPDPDRPGKYLMVK